MTIWILTILLVASTVGLGYRQGVIRASFSFVGIIFAALLAGPLGHLFRPVLAHVGFPNDTMAWLISPIVAFPVVLTAFKVGGAYFHRKSEAHYKHNVGELEFSIYSRLNHRLGACVGVLNGTAYLVLLTFVIFNFSFWTSQVAASDAETLTTRVINRLGKDATSTGLASTAGAVGKLPDNYYKVADLAGLICQNPDLSTRLARYPMFLSLLERDDVQLLVGDSEFTNAWATHAPMGEILNEPNIQNLLKNNDLLNTVWGLVEPNLDDLETYLKTGKSPKYDSEVALGYWDFNVRVSFAYLRLTQPKITSAEMRGARAWMSQAYADTILVVAGDDQAFLKYWPHPNPNPQPGQPAETINWKGQWAKDGTNYTFNLSNGSDSKTFSGATDGQRLILKDDKSTYVFDHE